MFYIIKFVLFLATLLLRLVFKLGFGLLAIYYAVIGIFLQEWVNKSQFNEAIAMIGFFIVLAYCIVNLIYKTYQSIKYGQNEQSHLS